MKSISFNERLEQIQYFYRILADLEVKIGGTRTLAECHGRMDWPERGVYFFFEPGEMRSTSGRGFRVVRVGTHGLKRGGKTKLWKRLSQHQGTQRTSGGNHRGSVFRLHVGTALIGRDSWKEEITDTWGVGSSAPREVRQGELTLEQAVSQHIRNMPFLYLEIDDEPGPESLRGYIERNAIALLSNYEKGELIDPPSENWLGQWARSDEIKRSSLWNVNHVTESYDPNFLDVCKRMVTNHTLE